MEKPEVINIQNEDADEIYEDGSDGGDDILAPKGQSPGAPAESEPEKIPFTEERNTIMRKIGLYKQHFPDVCALVDLNSLHYMNDEALSDYLSNVKFSVSNRNSNNLIKSGIDRAILAGEFICSAWCPRLSGLHSEISADPAYHDILTELSIEYGNLAYVRPEIRLAYLIASAAGRRIMTPPVSTVAPVPPCVGRVREVSAVSTVSAVNAEVPAAVVSEFKDI